ncbi:MAG: hypothetical protein FJ184_10705 [Gammaproteobacteria bacterium]|nr:hypothetical protein [Gammaproteobacteria bacterium]
MMKHHKQLLFAIVGIFGASLSGIPAAEAVSPPTRKVIQISNSQNVVRVKDASIEIFPERRVTVESSGEDSVIRETVLTSPTTSIKKTDGVLIFNYAYQAYGFATGEIVFKFKPSQAPSQPLASSLYPEFRRVGNTELYAVNARNPVELMSLYRKLAERSDGFWVQPTIRYAGR